jgi:hypothetical protein
MSTNPQASIKLSGTLESSDLLGFPILLNLTTRFYGSGEIKAFNRVTVNERNDVLQPDPLPGVAPKHAVKKVYMYLKNTSSEENQNINVYIIVEGRYIQIAQLEPLEFMFLPAAQQNYFFVDSDSGAPILDYLALEE